MSVPPQVPEKMARWYTAKELYIGKVAPEYSWAFSDRVCREMKKDFLTLAPIYQTFRGIYDQMNENL
jgi:hypothetical protein